MTPQFTKTEETKQLDADTVQTTYKSYTKELNNVVTKISKDIKTNQNDLLKDIVSCLDVLKETEDSLTITIKKRQGQVKLITKTWTVQKEYYGGK